MAVPLGPSLADTPRAVASQEAAQAFGEAVAIMARLRAPGGCPWDREQTPASIRKHTLEETYEVLDAIERGDPGDLCEELGDLLLQVLFYAQMAAEQGEFGMAEVLAGLNRKLVRRHPHVFGTEASEAAGMRAALQQVNPENGAAQVLANWHSIKQLEKISNSQDEEKPGRLARVLRAQPALLEAGKLGAEAAKVGFDWPDPADLIGKIREEVDEVAAELAPGEPPSSALQMEVGDLLFVTANLARKLGVEPETALRDANAKFRRRFAAMEKMERMEQHDGGPALEERSLDVLEELWQAAKRSEKAEL